MKDPAQRTLRRAIPALFAVFALALVQTAFAADWTDANDPSVTYTALKSIKGANSGYVVTDITPQSNDIVRMKFQPVAAAGALFCARDASASGMFTCYHSTADGSIRIDRGAKSTSNQKTSTSKVSTGNDYLLTADYGNKTATIVLSGGGADLFGKALGGADTYTVGSSLVLFAMHSNLKNYSSFGTDYIYYFELYDSSGNLTHCLLPAQCNTDSVYGFYDTRTGTFYPQSGGAFTAAARTITVTDTCKKWIGRGDGVSMSDGANWEGGVAPGDGDNLDFTLAPPLAEINADISGVTFGKLWIDDGDIPTFTGSMSVSDCNDRTKVAGNTSVVFPAGNYTWNGGAVEDWGAASAWTFDNASATWADNNNAIFSTADAEATLAADVTANSLVFNANATISGSSTLTVPSVTVASGVAATISAPTAGTLEKTGAGTLTLGSSRTDATTLSEGALELSGTASLDWTKFTLGTDAAKPVTLEFGPTATLSPVPATLYVGNVANITSIVVKAGGDWTFSNDVRVGSGAGSVASFYHKGGTISASRLFVGDDINTGHAGTGYCEISSGTITCSGIPHIGCYSDGVIVVTNDGQLVCNNNVYLGYNAAGTLTVADGGSVNLAVSVIMCGNSSNSHGVLNIGRGGIVSAKNAYRSKAGTATLNFDGGTFKKTGGTGNFFPVNGDVNAINATVSANGGTLDNNTFAVALPCTITGAGGMTLSGSGTTTISANQSYLGTTTVSNETTLSVSGGVTFAGPVVFNEDSALDIAGYNGTTPLSATAITFPDEGTVALTLDSGAFDTGVYKICAADDLTAADGEKFSIDTGDKSHVWSMHDNTLILLVGEVDANAWTGLAGDGKMSSAANWAGYAVPAAGEDIDLSGISADTTIIADANRTFGAVTMGDGVITFTNSFAATSFSDTSKVAVAADSTVTVVGDLVFSGSAQEYICHSVAAGGRFVVTGDIRSEKTDGHLYPSGEQSNPGVISAKGLVNNATNSDGFDLVRVSANWEIGANGISGTKRFRVQNYSNVAVMITATTNFTVSADIVQSRNLSLNPAGYEITLGDGTSGGILGGAANGLTTVTGTGKVVVDYNVNDLSSSASSRTNVFSVATGATLTLNPGANIGFGDLTVQEGRRSKCSPARPPLAT